ncbi:MAG: uroporphyrinogen-III synthase [Nitrospirota bacterium]|nr:MAG: uroporphyrinogen-III synthase [Nitrospirota bacterium]
MTERKDFSGLTVAAFESRMAQEMGRLIERYGGKPCVAPAMREIPLEENPQALTFGDQLLAGHFNMVVLLTGVGTRNLIDVLQTRFPHDSIKKALGDTVLVARGPKPVGALKELGLWAHVEVPEPNTWRDLIRAIDDFKPEGIRGLRVAVQEYGVSNPDLLEALNKRGGLVTPVPVYRWALPQDTGPMENTINSILAGKVDVVLITNAVQVDHIVNLLEQHQSIELFKQTLAKMVIASIGQIASERLQRHGFPVDLEPSHSKMGILVKETSERAHDVLKQKRSIS